MVLPDLGTHLISPVENPISPVPREARTRNAQFLVGNVWVSSFAFMDWRQILL